MYRTPAELIRDVRSQRGSDPGPPNVGYQENRSLEALDGTIPPAPMFNVEPQDPEPEVHHRVVHLPAVIPAMPPAPAQSGDWVNLSGREARLDKYDCRISEADAKAIRTILLKAIRREIRSLEKGT